MEGRSLNQRIGFGKWQIAVMFCLPLLLLIVLFVGLQASSYIQVCAASKPNEREFTTDPVASSKSAESPIPGWDGRRVIDPVVIKEGGIYKMWYTGEGLDSKWRIGYATSPDGINWTKYAWNPVLSR